MRPLVVRALQDGWCMGEDLALPVEGTELLGDVPRLIARAKGIGAQRIVLHKLEDPKPFADKLLKWDLNR